MSLERDKNNKAGVEMIACRTIHVLTEIYNDSITSLLFPFLLTCGVTQIMAAATLIQYNSLVHLPLPIYVFGNCSSKL